ALHRRRARRVRGQRHPRHARAGGRRADRGDGSRAALGRRAGRDHPVSVSGDGDERELARDREIVARAHNTARYLTDVAQVAWVALAFTILWGIYGYLQMPKVPEPVLEVRVVVATAAWPGAEAEKVEQLVTRRIEQQLAQNANIEKIE